MANRFLMPPQDESNPTFPETVYACLDFAEQLDPQGNAILTVWDAVDANWYDTNHERLTKAELLEEVPMFQFEMRLLKFLKDFQVLRKHVRDALPDGSDDEPVWFKIQFGPQPVETESTFYTSLLGQGTQRFIQRSTTVSPSRQAQLTRSFSLDDVTDASEQDVESFIDGISQIHHIIAYDVGQGTSAGLCNNAGAVLAYADVGAGTRFNRKTFPSALTSFCFGETPRVILTHWDSDHWAGAVIDNRFKRMSWLVPRQKTRPSHRAMAHEISMHGLLLVWPSTLQVLQKGQIQVEKCTGTDRNSSGLTLTLWHDSNRTAEPVLIPGDAGYKWIPSFAQVQQYFSTLVPHHGGRLPSAPMPSTTGSASSRAAYSYGSGNTYGHPHKLTRHGHHNAGWTDLGIDPRATPELCRRTSDRCPSRGLGHILVAWDKPSIVPNTACHGSSCQLGFIQ